MDPDHPDEPDDIALMLRVRSGDEDAFETLVERHQYRVIGTIAKMLGGESDAEDLAQQVFIRVWQSAPRYEPGAKFTTWLLTITRNLVFNECRRRGRARLVPFETDDEFGPRDRPDPQTRTAAEHSVEHELEQAIEQAIAALPEQQRLALVLRRYEDLAYEEIAEVLHVSVPSVKSLLFRARTELKERLARYLT
ncbi:MAG: sigma-70 family RNA polymerase sigma factor [Terrimicrobiaceae bacterium]|nr:sigma-70 family RNA polymerase sigma factor [Terrimicrobiaceae bacterium]